MPPTKPPSLLMTTEQVAERLGVKPATVYAYVSRGLLPSRRNGDGKGSLFSRKDVDAFVASRKRTTTPGIQTGITLIREGKLYYRGEDVCKLAELTTSFEAVTSLLWTGELDHFELEPPAALIRVADAAVRPLPADARATDVLRVIVAAAATADPLRFDTSPQSVVATGRGLLTTMVAALPGRATHSADQSISSQLWRRLTPPGVAETGEFAINTALVLLADHDIAASTLAARVAASTRANPYAVVSAGLAALDGPLHGAASSLAYDLLHDAMTRKKNAVGTIAERQRAGTPIPGFGHPLYPDGDPRATTLLDRLPDGPARFTAELLAESMIKRSGIHPNVDFALAALALHYGMAADAGEAIFAVARTAGWIAHALEEYDDRPSRFRFSGQYSGPLPTS